MKSRAASKPVERTALRDNDQRVLAALKASRGPLKAYQLLDILRCQGINGPPTVYRALERLCRQGLVHRVESMNAYIACRYPCHDEPAIFMICEHCGNIEERHDTAIVARLQWGASRSGLALDTAYLEARGRCQRCRGRAPR